MKTVYKYPVPATFKNFSLLLPVDYKFLRIAFQNEKPFLWAEIGLTTGKSEIKFAFYGTGHDIPASASFLQTFDSGPFVLHLYRL